MDQAVWGNRVYTLKWLKINATNSGDNELIAGIAARQIIVVGLFLVSSIALTLSYKSNGITKVDAMAALAGTPFFDPGPGPVFVSEIGGDFTMNLSVIGNVRGWLRYIVVEP